MVFGKDNKYPSRSWALPVWSINFLCTYLRGQLPSSDLSGHSTQQPAQTPMLKGQQLVRSICEHCSRRTRPATRVSAGLLASFNKGVTQIPPLPCPPPDLVPTTALRSSSRSPTATFWIETCETVELTHTQLHSLSRANRLATRATTMPAARTKKGDAPNAPAAANDATKMNAAPVKRKRRPGEQRYYAVRAGKIPGVYMSWAECQAMTNGFAGANCELLNDPWNPAPVPQGGGPLLKSPPFQRQPNCHRRFATDEGRCEQTSPSARVRRPSSTRLGRTPTPASRPPVSTQSRSATSQVYTQNGVTRRLPTWA